MVSTRVVLYCDLLPVVAAVIAPQAVLRIRYISIDAVLFFYILAPVSEVCKLR
jgi:hypothetical protein